MLVVDGSTSAASTLLLDPQNSTAPCWFPDSPADDSPASSDLRLARGFERASTVISRARVAGAALR
jgi:hypothetical protein